MFPEAYYVHIQGEQKGPYTFVELKRLYEQSFFPAETLYWQEGMERWLPVSELCGQPRRQREKFHLNKLLVLGCAGAAFIALIVMIAPIFIDGWKEASQNEFTADAAYWKARDYVRTELKKQNATVAFEAGKVTMGAGTAEVNLPCSVYLSGTASRRAVWHVSMRYDSSQRQWSGAAANEIKARH